MLKKLYDDRYVLIASVFLGLFISVAFAISTKVYADKIMSDLTSEVFRFHVIANSNSYLDQALKLKVRNSILDKYKYMLTSSDSKEETVTFFAEHIEDIEKTAAKVIAEEGYDYSVKAEIAKSIFPIKKYGDVTLPAGKYDCLKINIGKAQGHNWWCVMFPPLCYVDGTYEEIEEKKYSKCFDSETYDVILGNSKKAKPQVKIKLKIVEMWQGIGDV